MKHDCFTHYSGKLVLVYIEETQKLDDMDGYLQQREFYFETYHLPITSARTCVKALRGGRLSPLGSSIDTTMTDPSAPSRFLSASYSSNIAFGDTGVEADKGA
jgi:hypothetical protein